MIICTKNLAESQKNRIFVAYKQSNGNIDIQSYDNIDIQSYGNIDVQSYDNIDILNILLINKFNLKQRHLW